MALERKRSAAFQLHQEGDLTAAEKAYNEILVTHPADGQTRHFLAVLYGQIGAPQKVVESCELAIASDFRTPALCFNFAKALLELGQDWEAADIASKGLVPWPEDVDIAIDLLDFLCHAGREGECVSMIEAYAIHTPLSLEMLELLAESAASVGKASIAGDAFRKIIDATPQSHTAWGNLANFYFRSGDADAAEGALDHAFALNPDFSEGYFLLSNLRALSPGEPIGIEILKRAESGAGQRDPYMQFAAARVLDGAGEADLAFAHYAKGNRIVRAGIDYDAKRYEKALYELGGLSLRGPMKHLDDNEDGGPCPIFILGMPRSGSTLVETILAQNSEVESAGELVWFQRLVRGQLNRENLKFPEGLWHLSAEGAAEIRRRYLHILSQRLHSNPSARFCVDKLPANFLYIPLITQLFPKAPVIVPVRDGVETCLSCFRTLFSGPQHFAYDLREVAGYWRAMTHVLDSYRQSGLINLYTLEHERLVRNPREVIAELLYFCGLAQDRACLSPEKSTQFISTASSLQVREPIKERDQKQKDRYGEHIGPLLEEINA